MPKLSKENYTYQAECVTRLLAWPITQFNTFNAKPIQEGSGGLEFAFSSRASGALRYGKAIIKINDKGLHDVSIYGFRAWGRYGEESMTNIHGRDLMPIVREMILHKLKMEVPTWLLACEVEARRDSLSIVK